MKYTLNRLNQIKRDNTMNIQTIDLILMIVSAIALMIFIVAAYKVESTR